MCQRKKITFLLIVRPRKRYDAWIGETRSACWGGGGGGGEQFKKDCKKVLIKLCEKLTEKSPLNCTVTQNATSFDPGQMIN